MDDRVVAEIEHQHQLLATWIGSSATPDVLDELRTAHTDDFSMVTADGQVLDRRTLLGALAEAANSRPGLRILIDKVAVPVHLDGAVLVRFMETHVDHGHTFSRRVSALLVHDDPAPHDPAPHDAAPRGLRWRHVHETPISGEPR